MESTQSRTVAIVVLCPARLLRLQRLCRAVASRCRDGGGTRRSPCILGPLLVERVEARRRRRRRLRRARVDLALEFVLEVVGAGARPAALQAVRLERLLVPAAVLEQAAPKLLLALARRDVGPFGRVRVELLVLERVWGWLVRRACRRGRGEVAALARETAARLALDLVVVDNVAPRREAVAVVAVVVADVALWFGTAAVPLSRPERVLVVTVRTRASDALCGNRGQRTLYRMGVGSRTVVAVSPLVPTGTRVVHLDETGADGPSRRAVLGLVVSNVLAVL